MSLLECVVNVSEGRQGTTLKRLAQASGPYLLDLHSDLDHHRAVLTLAGPAEPLQDAVRSLAKQTVTSVDLRQHQGAHPRMGALDVVPWVSLAGWPVSDGPIGPAVQARDKFARWAGLQLRLPCFLYGPERPLPDVRRLAWHTLRPNTGPDSPHPTAGASAVGARPLLVAYNLWLAEPDLSVARAIAAAIRRPELRALGLAIGDHVQVSCNLIAPFAQGPAAVFDAVATRTSVGRAELVGLVPRATVESIPRHRWKELDLDLSTTIEARLEQAGIAPF